MMLTEGVRRFVKIVFAITALAIPLFVLVFIRTQHYYLSYECLNLMETKASLQEDEKKLLTERASLLRLDGFDEETRNKLGLVAPEPDRIVILER